VDRKIKTEMRNYLHPRLKDVRQEITRRLPKASPQEAEQLAVLTDDALGMQTALHFDGTMPFDSPAVAAAQALEDVANSLEQLEKKGGHSAPRAVRNWHD
jgi:hypothetical protein